MMKRLAAAMFALLLLIQPGQLLGHDGDSEMTMAMQRLLATLSEQQKEVCLFPFESPHRQRWNFVPDKFIQPDGKRYGLTLKQMSSQQRLLTHAVLNSVLSHEGYRQAVTIMNLEQVLHELENQNPIRDPDRYYLSIFGNPGDSTWAWRFEGHHLSLNFTVKDGQLASAAPVFFGTNPAEVREGNLKGLKVLAAEEALARDFLKTLSSEQKEKAVLQEAAPNDVLTGVSTVVDLAVLTPAADAGIKFSELTDQQKELLQGLVDEYASAFYQPALAEDKKNYPLDQDAVFAWLGSTEVGAAHYYRIKSGDFVLEYDNTQNDANHVHVVWRDLNSDFGEDLLKTHLKREHATPAQQ